MIFQNPLLALFFLFELLLMILTLGIGFNYILILKNWHFESHAPDQYRLEKINYLLSISGRILLAGRMIAFGLLIFVVDSLADHLCHRLILDP